MCEFSQKDFSRLLICYAAAVILDIWIYPTNIIHSK